MLCDLDNCYTYMDLHGIQHHEMMNLKCISSNFRVPVCVCSVARSCPTVCDPMDCSLPGSLTMGYPKQEYWNRLQFSTPGDIPNSGIEAPSPEMPALAGLFFTTEPPGKP